MSEDKHYKVRVSDEGVLSVDEVVKTDGQLYVEDFPDWRFDDIANGEYEGAPPVVLHHSFKPVADDDDKWQQPETD